MTSNKASVLSSDLIVRKGEASPTVMTLKESPVPKKEIESEKLNDKKRVAITVKLEAAMYENLKLYGARNRKTNQDLIVEAINKFLS